MTHIKNQYGNILFDALGMVTVGAIFLLSVALWMYPNKAIDKDQNGELQKMVNAVKGTSFETAFKAKINYDLSDGKISNSEFSSLEELFSGYKSSKLTGEDQKFSETIKKDLESQYKNDQQIAGMSRTSFFIVSFFSILGIVLIGLKIMKF